MKKLSVVPMLIISVFLLVGCNKVLTKEEVDTKVKHCTDKGKIPWYTFVKQGNKESGVLFIECRTQKEIDNDNKPSEESDSSLFDDDTPVTAGGMPSMSGLPGGPF